MAGGWRDRAKTVATFRGAEFRLSDTELAGGRRTARHEYPGRDVPYVEDLGRKARAFDVDGYVVGDDYLTQRDTLLAALETEGPGELIHPYYGSRMVIATSVRVRDSSERGGMARFGITFEETDSAPAFPTPAPAQPDQVEASADAVDAAVDVDFPAEYDTTGLPVFSLASLTGMVASAGVALQTALAPLVTARDAAAKLKHDLDNLILGAADFIREPAEILGGLRAALSALGDPTIARIALSSILNAYGFAPGARPPSTTANRVQEQRCWDALLLAIQACLLAWAARLVATASWPSYDEAVAARDRVVSPLDDAIGSVPDATFTALEQLRADLVRGVPGDAEDLPRLVHYTPPGTVPSLVLAHRLYGDIAREQDLLVRNHVFHPGFVLGGRPLEVLSDA